MRTPVVSALHDSSVTSPGPVLKFVLRPPPVPHWYKRWPTRENRIRKFIFSVERGFVPDLTTIDGIVGFLAKHPDPPQL